MKEELSRQIACLRIGSFDLVGGIHFYGTLEWNDHPTYTHEEVYHELTTREAQRFNKEERWISLRGNYKKGSRSNKFDSEDQVHEWAIKAFLKKPLDAKILLLDNYLNAERTLAVIDKNLEPLMKELNELSIQADECGRWEGDQLRMREICKEWEATLERGLL